MKWTAWNPLKMARRRRYAKWSPRPRAAVTTPLPAPPASTSAAAPPPARITVKQAIDEINAAHSLLDDRRVQFLTVTLLSAAAVDADKDAVNFLRLVNWHAPHAPN